MFLRSGGTDVQVKSLLGDAWPYPVIPAEFSSGMGGMSADPVWPFQSIEQAMGLPALLGVLLRISTACGMLPQKVYQGVDQLNRLAATDTWQYDLLHNRPGEEHTPFTLRADIALSIAGMGYCCVRAFKVPDRDVEGGKRIAELLPLDSRRITPKRKNGQLIFEDRTEGGDMVPRTTDEIIYIRAPATSGGVQGLAPITLSRMGLMTALKRQVFEGSYYDNGAQPGTVLAFPERMPSSEAEEWVELYDDRHQGPGNAHRTSAIGGGATVTTLPISLVDAQFVDSSKWTADQYGFIYGMPKSFMNTAERAVIDDNDWRYFVTFGLGWIMHAIDQAFSSSRLLFPRGSDMHVETLMDALLKPDIQTRYEAYKAARQAGWLTANEIRALENYPPRDGGDELQATPVGGAPNTAAAADAAKALDELDTFFQLEGNPEQKQILAKARRRMIEALAS